MKGRSPLKIAVLGFTEHKRFAPFNELDWELWGLNDLYLDLPPVPDAANRLRWFQIHDYEEKEPATDKLIDFSEGPPHPRDPGHLQHLRVMADKGVPVYLMQPKEGIPTAQTLPRERIINAFRYGPNGSSPPVNYYTNTITWMIALAVLELTEETTLPDGRAIRYAKPGAQLGVYGVDMMVAGGQGSEYGYQRPSCEWALGAAMAYGITVTVPKESDLLKSAFNYGEQQATPFRRKLDQHRTELSRRRGMLNQQMQQAQLGVAELSGALNTLDWIRHAHLPGDEGSDGGIVPMPGGHKRHNLLQMQSGPVMLDPLTKEVVPTDSHTE